MSTKLSINELTTSMRLVVLNNLKTVNVPRVMSFSELGAIAPTHVLAKIQTLRQENIPNAELNFVCGAFAASIVHNALQTAGSKDELQTLFLVVPSIIQDSKTRFTVNAVYLTLPQSEMAELLTKLSDLPHEQQSRCAP